MSTALDTEVRTKFKEPSKYNVLLLNDDFTPMDFVVTLLQDVFQMSYSDACALMMEIHNKGRGIAGSYTKEQAAMKAGEALELAKANGHPLRVTIEQSED